MLVDAVFLSPYNVGANYARYKRESGITLFEYLLKHALRNLVYEYERAEVPAVHPGEVAGVLELLDEGLVGLEEDSHDDGVCEPDLAPVV